MAEKNYRASTGVDEFYYAVIENETDNNVVTGDINRVKFLQNIEIEMPQEATRAYGDNRTAEIAISSGNITVTSAFHKIPAEDKQILFGLETVDGVTAFGGNDKPPYVAVVFAKTHEDGSKEWVGLTKGIFMRPNITGQTKEDGVEFSNEEITAEFMDRYVEGFSDAKSVLFAFDEKGETSNRDTLFMKVFGQPHPNTETDPEGA